MWWSDREARRVLGQDESVVRNMEEYEPRLRDRIPAEDLLSGDLQTSYEVVRLEELVGNGQRVSAFEEWVLLIAVFEWGFQVCFHPLQSHLSCLQLRLHADCRFYRDLLHGTDLMIAEVE
jgi:hypothetical protein